MRTAKEKANILVTIYGKVLYHKFVYISYIRTQNLCFWRFFCSIQNINTVNRALPTWLIINVRFDLIYYEASVH